MFAKGILVFCAQALLAKSALGQCTSPAAVAATPGFATTGISAPFGLDYNGIATSPFGLAGPGLAYDGNAIPGAGWAGRGFAYDGLAPGCANRGLAYDGFYGPGMEFSPTCGGALPVTSGSAVAPVGISVVSENVYEGALNVAGELPFVGTVAMEGVLPTAGAGAVNHACGNGVNAMISDRAAFGPSAYAPAAAMSFFGPYGLRPGLGDITYPAGWAGAIVPDTIAAPALGYLGG